MGPHAGHGPTRQLNSGFASAWPLQLTPVRVVILLAALIFTSEFIVMLLLSTLPPMSRGMEAVVDSCMLLFLLSPAYFFLFLPLKTFYLEHQQADADVHRLSRQLLTIVEEEKKRIALDLHDACGQTIAALQYKLGALSSALPPGTSAEQKQQYEQVNHLVHQLSNHIRNLTSSLRPVMLEHLGLVATLEWHLTTLAEQRQELKLSFHHDSFSGLLPPEVEIALFRICQEALNNVCRHAHARRVVVTLERTTDLLWIADRLPSARITPGKR
jgi:signal transduction histidine kinase